MKLSRIGRATLALVVSVAMGLGMTSCGGGTVGFMWVLGTQYNQIGGFKIDNFSGNLTGIVGSPVPSGGTDPIMLVTISGGRYLYVLNAGDSTGQTGNVSLFSVGADGTLSYQQSYTSIQGTFPVWLTLDTAGKNLYVLAQRSPAYDGKTDLNGSITVFPLDANTGRPSSTPTTYLEVGASPTRMANSATCLYTLDTGDQTVFPTSIDATSGQLTANPTFALGTTNATSVNIGGNFVYVTDAGSTIGGPGSIVGFSQGSSCALSAISGGNVANLPTASNPIQTINTTDGKYVYVLNHSTLNTNYSNSTISAFTIGSNGVLTAITSDTNNPYSVGSGPACMAIDPTNQYIYTSDQFASTVTGKRLSNQYGYLASLSKGSTFATVGTPSCLTVSRNASY